MVEYLQMLNRKVGMQLLSNKRIYQILSTSTLLTVSSWTFINTLLCSNACILSDRLHRSDYWTVVEFLANRTARNMIGCWHYNAVCLSVRPSVCVWRCALWLNDTSWCYRKCLNENRKALMGTRFYKCRPTVRQPCTPTRYPVPVKLDHHPQNVHVWNSHA